LLAQSEAQCTPTAHIALYKNFLKVSDHLLPTGALEKPTLWHWDIHAPNTFIHKDRVTSLIDWQDVWIGPLFLQARQLRLVRYTGEMLLRLSENYESLTDQDERAKLRSQVQSSVAAYIYDDETKTANPLLDKVMQLRAMAHQARHRGLLE
jgi:aminoglycoside phosphotransferase (APT) family kinase protein